MEAIQRRNQDAYQVPVGVISTQFSRGDYPPTVLHALLTGWKLLGSPSYYTETLHDKNNHPYEEKMAEWWLYQD